jgi:phage shock protein A
MTKYSKVLVVVTAAASLLFLGIAVAAVVGGPNWNAEREELADFTFEISDGDPPMWTVRTRRPQRTDNGSMEVQTVGAPTPVLAEAIARARDFQLRQQREELERIENQIPQFEAAISETRELIEIDLKAVRKREAELTAELEAIHDQIEELTAQAIAKAEEARVVRLEGERRRDDVFRLRNQLAELRTDRFRAIEQKNKLEDRLRRLRGDNEKLERRRQDLLEMGANPEYEEPAPGQ